VTSVIPVRPRKIGLLGGTFDPPHIGHLLVAVEVRFRLGLDRMLMVPNGDPWQKRGTRAISPAEVRMAMLHAAVEQIADVEVSDVEVRRPGNSYTVDTVEHLLHEDPGSSVTVVVGSDAARGLTTWERHRDLFRLVTVAVVRRPGDHGGAVAVDGARIVDVDVPALDVSSSELRRRVADGEPIDVMTPAGVIDIIRSEDLYRREAAHRMLPARAAPRPNVAADD